jgi:hypothetical protein
MRVWGAAPTTLHQPCQAAQGWCNVRLRRWGSGRLRRQNHPKTEVWGAAPTTLHQPCQATQVITTDAGLGAILDWAGSNTVNEEECT